AFQKEAALQQRQDAVHTEEWDGTLGSLVLGLSEKNSQYLSLLETYASAATVLRAMKLLTKARVTKHTERRIRSVCADVFGEKEVAENEKIWREAIKHLESLQFIRTEDDGVESIVVIRKDTYFEQVIT